MGTIGKKVSYIMLFGIHLLSVNYLSKNYDITYISGFIALLLVIYQTSEAMS